MAEKAERDAAGRFLPGYKGGPGHPAGLTNQARLRHYFASLVNEMDLNKVYLSMLDLAINCPEYKTRLAAQIHYLDRVIGKVVDQMSVEVNNINPIADVPDAMARLRTLLNQTQPTLRVPSVKVIDEEREEV